jgi:hypothetical protein
VEDDDATIPSGMRVVLLAQQASAESRFEELLQRLVGAAELPPTTVLRVRAELSTLIENIDRLIKLLDEHRQQKR